MNQMGNKDSAPVLRDEDVAMLAETSGLGEEVKRNWNELFMVEDSKAPIQVL